MQRIAFAGKPVVIRTTEASSPPANVRNTKLLMHTGGDESFIGNSAEDTELGDLRLRFVVEESRNFRGLVHIKSSCNNKYLVLQHRTSHLIVAGADEIEEDQSKWNCTLFHPYGQVAGVEGYRCRFRHRGGGSSVLFAMSTHLVLASEATQFEIVLWDKMVIFPQHVTFKEENTNNGFLSARTVQKLPYLQFASHDIGDPTIGNQVFMNLDGTIRIWNNHFGKFWRRSPNWIWCDASESNSFQPDCLFRPVKLGDNVVALRNMGNNYFCRGLSVDRKRNCLNAAVPNNILNVTRLVVDELVLSRRIYNVEFRVEDAKVDVEEVPMAVSNTVINLTKETTSSVVRLACEDSKSSTWNTSVSLSLGGSKTLTAGVPFVSKGKIEISAQATFGAEYGKTNTSASTVEVATTMEVPPMSRRRVMVVAQRQLCHSDKARRNLHWGKLL